MSPAEVHSRAMNTVHGKGIQEEMFWDECQGVTIHIGFSPSSWPCVYLPAVVRCRITVLHNCMEATVPKDNLPCLWGRLSLKTNNFRYLYHLTKALSWPRMAQGEMLWADWASGISTVLYCIYSNNLLCNLLCILFVPRMHAYNRVTKQFEWKTLRYISTNTRLCVRRWTCTLV